MTRKDMDLLQGTLDVLILKALEVKTTHGYGVIKWLRDRTEGTLEVEEGALYTALHRMEKKGWLAAEWGVSDNNRRAKFYCLTTIGKRQLDLRQENWHHYAEAVHKVLET